MRLRAKHDEFLMHCHRAVKQYITQGFISVFYDFLINTSIDSASIAY